MKSKREPGLWMEDVPRPEVGPNDVLVRVKKTGICGTDLHIYKWDEWAARFSSSNGSASRSYSSSSPVA